MQEESTILLSKNTINALKEAKEHPRQTYNELITMMTKLFIGMKKKKDTSYDTFLHEIQKNKMKELWDNEHDAIWDTV
jgi:hypothetical protein